MCSDACLVPGCERTRRWGNPDNVKAYCEQCTAYVLKHGSIPALDSRGIVDLSRTAQAEPYSGPEGGRQEAFAQCA